MEEQKITEPGVEEQEVREPSKFKKWFKRIGFWGLMFFIIKGTISTAIILYTAYLATKK